MTIPSPAPAPRRRAFVARPLRRHRLLQHLDRGPRRCALLAIALLAPLAWIALTRAAIGSAFAQVALAEEPTEYGVKGVFLQRFATTYVKWPESAFPDKTSPFVVAILGKDPFGKSLQELFANQRVGDHPIKIVRFAAIDELDDCQMLFVTGAQEKNLKKVQGFYGDKPVFIVAESISAAQSGAHLGFYLEKSRVRFAINSAAAKLAKLEISSELLKLAKIVENKSERDP